MVFSIFRNWSKAAAAQAAGEAGIVPDGNLSRAALKALESRLKPMSKVKRKLDQRAFLYVARGEGRGVLLDIEQSQGCWRAIEDYMMARGSTNRNKHSETFFDNCGGVTPDLLIRYAEVLAAAARSDNQGLLHADRSGWPDWLRAFLLDLMPSRYIYNGNRVRKPIPATISAGLIGEMLRLDEHDPEVLIGIVFERSGWRWNYDSLDILQTLPGLADFMRNHPEAMRRLPKELSADGRACLARFLPDLGLVPEPYLDVLIKLAMDSSKKAREAAAKSLTVAKDAAKEPLLALLEKGSAGERYHAVQLLNMLHGGGAGEALSAHLEREKSKKVIEAIEGALSTAEVVAAAEAGQPEQPETQQPQLEIPEYQRPDLQARLGPEWEAVFQEAVAATNDAIAVYNALKDKPKYAPKKKKPLSAGGAAKVVKVLNGDQPARTQHRGNDNIVWQMFSETPADKLSAALCHPEFGLANFLRLIIHCFGDTRVLDGFWTGHTYWKPLTDWIERRFLETGDLRALADALKHVGEDPETVGRELLEETWGDENIVLSPAGVWPYFAERLELIDEGLGLAPRSGEKSLDVMRTLKVLRLFPALPSRYVAAVFDLALGEAKTPRPLAKEILETIPGKEQRIVKALASSKQEVRTLAAEWLAELDHKPAAEPLRKALKKEKREVAKAAMLSALQRLGEDLEPFLGQAVLEKEAQAALKKGLPKSLAAWFPVDAIPAARWRSSGKPVAPEIVTWWLAVAFQLKQPGGSGLLELYLDLLEPEDAAKLGRFVLDAFIGHDTRRPTVEEANAHAEAGFKQLYQSWKRWMPETTEKQTFDYLKREKLGQYFGSAIKEKGVLALTTRIPGREMVPILQAYMREHFIRRAQIEAMLETLVAVNDTASIQLLLAVAQRYRTKSVQEKARALVEAVAEKNGWTPDQLADRTIPSAGLDEHGVLEFDCGMRTFTARLDDDLKFVLTNPDGKVVKALPAPRKGEDPEPLKAAKKEFSAAKKELKQVVTLQKQRLYEALCTERRWPASEWRQFLKDHPIMGRYCQRVIWMVVNGDTPGACFRLLEDGSLSDADDEAVDLPDQAQVMLAHAALMPEAQVEAWRTHLKDYEVDPLYPQVSRAAIALPEADREKTEIADRKGHMMDSYTLRGQATKLGFLRGEAQDAGFFYEYYKEFPGLGLQVSLEFTGNCLPEENIPVALTELKFLRKGRGRYSFTSAKLEEVPKVLLSEAWADYHTIAEAGTGFAPDWEKKVQW